MSEVYIMKNKIKIGSLVKVSTYANMFDYHSGNYGATWTTTTSSPSTTTVTTSRAFNKKHTGLPAVNTIYDQKEGYEKLLSYAEEHNKRSKNVKKTEVEKLFEVLNKHYMNNGFATKKIKSKNNTPGGGVLGMTYMSNKNNKTTHGTNFPSSGSFTASVAGVGNYYYSTGTSTTTTAVLKYFASGFATLEDFTLNQIKKIEQTELVDDTERITNALYSKDKYQGLFDLGKPFLGIVVDAYRPKTRTEKGEKVPEIGRGVFPTLYKVLLGEKECCWFIEDDVFEVKEDEVKK